MKKNQIHLVLLAISSVVLVGCGKTTVDLDEYLTIEVDGYDSMGEAKANFDIDALEDEYYGKIKDPDGDKADIRDFVNDCVSGNLNKTSGLSNGDTVIWTWDCKENRAEEDYNVKFKCSDIEYAVGNLKKVESFNPFDYLSVTFTGTSPYGAITLNPDSNQPEMSYISFSADKKKDLKTGDTVTVSASIEIPDDAFVEKFGKIPGKTEETYTVEGLAHYVKDLSEIPSDMYNKMDTQLQDELAAEYVNLGWDNSTITNMELLGNYMLYLKEGMDGSPANYVYFIYEVTFHHTNDEYEGDYSYYWYGYYTDVMILEDGTCSFDLSNYTVPQSDWILAPREKATFLGGKLYAYGYNDLDSLFNKHVVSKKDKYDYVDTVKQ